MCPLVHDFHTPRLVFGDVSLLRRSSVAAIDEAPQDLAEGRLVRLGSQDRVLAYLLVG